jgi:predicted dehydrogenase
VAVCSATTLNKEIVEKKFGIKKFYTDYREILEKEDIDMVDIATPNYLHAPIAVSAAEAGKHILIQKPMATTLEECDRIINAARKAGVKLSVIHTLRFEPPNFALKSFIEDGLLGEVAMVRGRLSHGLGFSIQSTDWRYSIEKTGGGAFIQLGIHLVDLFRWYLGDVVKVSAFSKTLFSKMEGDDITTCLVEFRSGGIGVLETSYVEKDYQQRIEVYGSDGLAVIDNRDGYMTFLSDMKSRKVEKIPFKKFKNPEGFSNPWEHFVNCILNDREPMVSGRNHKESLRVVLSAYKSAKENVIVEIS